MYHPCSSEQRTRPAPSKTRGSTPRSSSTSHSWLVDNYGLRQHHGRTQRLRRDRPELPRHRRQDRRRTGHGYIKNYEYDDRLATDEPPYFLAPLKAGWKVVRETAPSPRVGLAALPHRSGRRPRPPIGAGQMSVLVRHHTRAASSPHARVPGAALEGAQRARPGGARGPQPDGPPGQRHGARDRASTSARSIASSSPRVSTTSASSRSRTRSSRKPAALDAAEWEVMRTHAEIGAPDRRLGALAGPHRRPDPLASRALRRARLPRRAGRRGDPRARRRSWRSARHSWR